MCRNVAFLAWISCVHLVFPGTSILSPKVETSAVNATQNLLARKSSSVHDQTPSNSFNVLRGLYPHLHPAPAPHPDNEFPYSHQPPPTHGCGACPQPNILVLPISGQYLSQPKVKHTIKTVITDMKEITTPLNDGSGILGRNLANLSFNGPTKSTNKEQDLQIVLPSDDDDGIDLPLLKELAGLEPIELEDNYVTGGPGFNPEKGFLFRPYFKPATAATLSAPGHKAAQPFSFPRPFNLPPFNLAYLRPRPLPVAAKDEQWRPSPEISYGVPARHASSANIAKAAADPCGDDEPEAKATKVDAKIKN